MPPARSDSEKDPNPLLFPFVRDFFLSEAGAFFSSASAPTRFSSRTPFARPDWRSARRRSGARQFFRSPQDFFEVQTGERLCSLLKFQGGVSLKKNISPRLIALSCLSLTWTSRQHFKKRRAEPGVREPGNISPGPSLESQPVKKSRRLALFFFFRQIPLKSPCRRSHRSATAGVTDTPFASTFERLRETARFRAR